MTFTWIYGLEASNVMSIKLVHVIYLGAILLTILKIEKHFMYIQEVELTSVGKLLAIMHLFWSV